MGKIERERSIASLPPLTERLLRLAKEHEKLTIRTAAAATDESRNTIKAHLARLVDEGYLVRQGVGRGTWYSLSR